MKYLKLFRTFIILCFCIYSACYSMDLKKSDKKQELSAKIAIASFYRGNYGVDRSDEYFSEILPNGCKLSLSKNPLKSSASSFYQDCEAKEFKKVVDRVSKGEIVFGSKTFGFEGAGKDQDFIKENKKSLQKKIVVGGYCKGASIICTTCVKHAKELREKKVSGIFLEAPIGSFGDYIDYMFFYLPKFFKIFFNKIHVKYALKSHRYNIKEVHPIDIIKCVKELSDLPILFIISKNDCIIPNYLSLKLARQMAEAGYKNIYVYIYNKNNNNILAEDITVVLKRFWNILFLCFSRSQFKIDHFHGVANNITAKKEYKNLLQNFIALCVERDKEKNNKNMKNYKKNNKELLELEKRNNSWRNYAYNKTCLLNDVALDIIKNSNFIVKTVLISVPVTIFAGYITWRFI